jgi:polyisoprenoid-binding protein YceI
MKHAAGQEEVDLDQLVGHWLLDGAQSKVRFAERILWGLVKVHGRFTALTGSGTVDPEGKVTGSLTVEAALLETNNEKRDEHLRSSDFFDVVRHPLITVDVSAVTIRGDVTDVHAALVIKGVREPITLTACVDEVTADTIRLKAQAKVDRGRFGMTWNKMGSTRQATIVADAVFRRLAQ